MEDWDIDNFIGSIPNDLDGLQDSLVETDLPPGVYFVRVTDSTNGCVTLHSDTVFDPGPIVLTPLGFDSVSCNGFSDGTAFVGGVTGVTGGNGSVYSYTWTDALGVDLLQDNDTAVGLSGGVYDIRVEDSKLCFATGQITVEEPSAIDITPLGFDSVSCNGFSDGTAFVGGVTGVTGGNGSVYSYTWTDALGVDLLQDNDTAVGLLAGVYDIRVEDSKLCFATGQSTVEEPSAIDITPLGFDSVICNGFSDGTAFVGGVTGVTGGNGSVYSYTWTDALGVDLLQDNDTAVGLSAGVYDIRVEDSKLCLPQVK